MNIKDKILRSDFLNKPLRFILHSDNQMKGSDKRGLFNEPSYNIFYIICLNPVEYEHRYRICILEFQCEYI